MDCGYPSRELFLSLCAREVDFCTRLKETGWNVVEEFLVSGKKEQLVTLTLTNKEFDVFYRYSLIVAFIFCQVPSPSGLKDHIF